MSRTSAIVGVSDHSGWAVLVTVLADGTPVDRRRIELVDAGLPNLPHHHEAQTLPLRQALDLIERVRLSAERHAKAGLAEVGRAVATPIRAVAMRECPQLPATVAERIQNYRAQTMADTVMYRMALAGAAGARGWSVQWYQAKQVLDTACTLLRVATLDGHFAQARKSFGPPWGRDHKLAMAAAIVARQTAMD